MSTSNDFWLNVHRLAQSYDREGGTLDERTRSIEQKLTEMPHLAQREVLLELCRLVTHLPDLYSAVLAASSEMQRARTEDIRQHEKHEHEEHEHEKVA